MEVCWPGSEMSVFDSFFEKESDSPFSFTPNKEHRFVQGSLRLTFSSKIIYKAREITGTNNFKQHAENIP